MGNVEKRAAVCGVCPGGCGVKVTLEDGKLSDIQPLSGSPYGAICLRGKHASEVVYSPERLTTPLIREGERGEGRFRQASWDEALDLITSNFLRIRNEYGPEAVASHSGRGAFEQSLLDFNADELVASKLLWPFGSPNIASVSSLCYASFGVFASLTTYGLRGKNLVPDLENSNLIVVWGANPATDSPPFMFERILKAKRKGTRIVAIDHMRSDIAERADRWVPVRSGTDGALVLGLLRVIINEKLYDEEFVTKWTSGFEELADYVQSFTPQYVETITKVPAETIVSLAREIATAKPATIRTYTGLEYSNSGVQTIRAVYILWAITGNLDVPGGLYINLAPPLSFDKPSFPRPETKLPIGAEEYPLFYHLTGCAQFLEFPKAVLEGKPYPIKGLLNSGASILTSYPQTSLWEKALRQLDFFAVIDRFMTRDALFADVVLPATTYFENTSYQCYPGYVRLRQPVINPVGEARNDLFILAEIARRLGYGELYPKDEAELLQRVFSRKPELLEQLRANPEGVALPVPERQYKKYESGALRPDGRPGFDTPSGRLEITSKLLADFGYPALPEYTEPIEGPLGSPELFKEFPLVLNTGTRIQSTFRSQHLNIPGLLKHQPYPEILIHPSDAEQRDINDGDKVILSTKRGNVRFFARVTEIVQSGEIEANMGGGSLQALEWSKGNANIITDIANRDPISGFPVFKALLCQVRKDE
ncbi:Acetylene hydratase [Sporomusa silvacetica DSM 10669]|uniref:Acetylene hydratase n=1 Tax=Sporomusa silvacetica DSM 10669 TaxID=1123289 RepID=A0ABZ3IH29_9FIRM|nr:molybdopterin-dependent oxidoreductase [Sporomusa silvacetica]OZC14821.1 acetylene hydratase [Sporomusa silvacetica DSM 10669]